MKIVLGLLLATCAAFTLLGAQTGAKKTPARSAHRSANGPSLLNPASLKEKAPGVYRAKFTTTKGDFVVEVNRASAPLGADRFYNLVKYKFYDGASFFRVLPGFVAQFGISSRPEIAKLWAGATIPDDPVTQSNQRGTLSFATAGPNTRTTQVFINFANNTPLDKMGFAPFGKLVEGMDVVDSLYSGYGEGAPTGQGPDQGRITNEGKAYIDKNFPHLDSIKSAVIVPSSSQGAAAPPKAAKEKP
jgi:peptidyl-prolyl cis-trans isomerase A (cyclophilin A)